jgi:hypothetical protein
MVYTEPAVLATYKATSVVQAVQTGMKAGHIPDSDQTQTVNPAYEGDE